MAEKKIKTAILGLSQKGAKLLKPIEDCDLFDISAIADKDIEVAEKNAKIIQNCKAYNDYRQMIMQNDLDLLIVAEPIHDSIEHIRTAIKKKINIFKLTPAARDFTEASELAAIAKSEKICFALGNYWRNSASWQNLNDHIKQNHVNNPSLIEVQWRTPAEIPQEKSWMRDPKLSGGGVLLYQGYQAIDIVTHNFGIPDQVYALNITNAPDRQQRAYLCEDTAIIMMRFSESLNANLIISRTYGPTEKSVRIYGKNQNLQISENSFKTFTNEDLSGSEFEYFDQPEQLIKTTLTNLANNIANPKQPHKVCTITDNLPAMSVIQAAYVSAKTMTPEEPGKILSLTPIEKSTNWLK